MVDDYSYFLCPVINMKLVFYPKKDTIYLLLENLNLFIKLINSLKYKMLNY